MPDGICIAFGQNAYNTSPTWTRIDDPHYSGRQHKGTSPYSGRFVASWESHRGRAYELDKTEAGTATITCYDTTGYFDPTNPASPFYGQITPMMQVKINAMNPSNLAHSDQFTGFVESWTWTMDTAEQIMTVKIGCVDGFEPLARGELQANQSNGTTVLTATQTNTDVQTRINDVLDLANWPNTAAWRSIFTGNVYMYDTTYNAQTSFLSAIQDAADAEFPGVANFYIAKNGQATFHGRYARFNPTDPQYGINFWEAGDESAADTFGTARIAEIEWAVDSKNLINVALAYPTGIKPSDLPGQLVTDSGSYGGTSETQYGIRTLSLPDLLNAGQGASVSQPAADANTACKYFAQYYVQNYAQPQLRITKLIFRSRRPGDSQTWALMTGVEIGDIITVYTHNPGGGGFSKETGGVALHQFFVEGITNTVNPLTDDYPDWTVSLDVSPRGWFTYEPWAN